MFVYKRLSGLSLINEHSIRTRYGIKHILLLIGTMVYIYLHTRALGGQHSDPCAHSALEPFFGDFSASRPRFVSRLAPSDSPQPTGPCPRAGPPIAAAVVQR